VFNKEGELLNYTSQYENFNQLSIAPVLLDNLSTMEFSEMTPIQKTVLPLVMKNENIIACAETGSGKTVAFLLPIINKMISKGPPDMSAHENSKLYS
jgi:ATP-dependent RNA helicase DDX3X